MIVVDSSAFLAIMFNEPEAEAFDQLLARDRKLLPVSCFIESASSWRRRGGGASAFDRLIKDYELELAPNDARQAQLALEADRRYGRGTGHPARLNFGDCLAYAAAIAHDAPLLFKGDDFIHTDVKRAV